MNKFEKYSRYLAWILVLTLSTLVAGCGGGGGGSQGRAPILGSGSVALPPTVTAVAPVDNATGVTINNTVITAAFSEPVQPITGAASFTVTCAAPCANPAGSVSLDATSRIATFALASGETLTPRTVYTATVTAAKSIATGLTMTSPFVWHFTTGAQPSTIRPSVALTVPATTTPGPTTGVPTNSAITAVFTQDMDPATIVPPAPAAATFTLTGPGSTVVAGNVTYATGSRTATFTPNAVLAVSTTYTATITSAATNLAGVALAGNQAPLPAASDYVWTFTTGPGPAPAGNVTVLSTNPASAAVNVPTSAAVNATFSVPSGLRMNPATVTTATFTVTGPAPTFTPVTAASVVLDTATGHIATFTPQSALTAGVTYTATIKGGASGVKDLAIPANTMVSDYSWNFTVASTVTPPPPPPSILGSASTFGDFGGSAGMTNSGLFTVVNGDIGTTAVSTAVTGFHDAGPGCTYTETPLNVGTVNGLIYTAPPPPTVACPTEGTAVTFAIATQARADALAAYNALVALPVGANPGANLAGLTLAPGTYTAPAGSFMIQGGDLTLDAQGDANAVWVFQMATTLTVGGPGAAAPQSIILANGAQAKNVYWQVGSAATINAGGGGTMVGTIIAQAGAAFSTAGNVSLVTLNGRALSLGASVTLVNTVINVPAP